MEGTTLDRYEVLEKVGEGGMATVYRGHHRALGREVALKILHPHLAGTPRNRQRFEREARAIETLRHPNIVEIFDYSGPSDGACYIVTEFIHGFTLKAWLDTRTLPGEIAASVGEALCSALHYAHTRGIIHRDIKPENVMIRPDGHVTLMDFGIARVLDDTKVTLTGGLVGSPAYMSPEQALDGELGPKSDQFSLGILLYRAVTGHLPFVGKSPPIILRHIVEGNYADPMDVVPSLDPDLAAVIRRALSQDPEARFPTAAAFGQALAACLTQAQIPGGDAERARYFAAPEAYAETLRAHILATQLPRARALAQGGKTAQAMAILGRLLSLEEDNAEILALLGQLHHVPSRAPRAVLSLVVLLAIPLTLLAIVSLGGGGPSPQGQAPTPEAAPRASQGRSAALAGDPFDTGRAMSTPTLDAPSPETPGDAPEGDAAPAPAPAPDPALEGAPDPKRPPRTRPSRLPVSRPAQPKLLPGEAGLEGATAAPEAVAQARTLPGTLDLQSNPWAEIYVDGSRTDPEGRAYGNTLRAQPISLSPGRHTLRLVNPRCAVLEEELAVEAGQILRRAYKLCPRLKIVGVKPGERVELDGVAIEGGDALSKPILLTSPPAVHTVAVIRADGRRLERQVTPPAPHGVVVVDLSDPSGGS